MAYKSLEWRKPSNKHIMLSRAKITASLNKCSSLLPKMFPSVKAVIQVNMNAINDNAESRRPMLINNFEFFIVVSFKEKIGTLIFA